MIDHSDPERISELTAGYALDALDPEERQWMSEHLADCGSCQEAVAQMREAAAVLALSAPLASPPPALRGRVLDQVRREGTAPARAAVQEPREPRRGFWALFFGSTLPMASAAAAVVLLAVMATALLRQQSELSRLRAQVQAQQQAQQEVQRLLASPGVQTARMESDGIQASMLMAPDSAKAYVVLSGLPALPEGRDYQVWLGTDAGPTSAGVFHASGQANMVVSGSEPLKSYKWIGITQEPSGGSPAPTTKPILMGNLRP